jgi:AcrR family transcriptional regulator
MTSPNPVRATEDLTARARIRDAALELFAERGMRAATIRDIAKAAGVSAALVRHHFGSKDALRDACDAYAVDQLLSVKRRPVVEGLLANNGLFDLQPAALPLMRYFARSMVDGSPQAAIVFDRMVALAEEWMRRNRPGHSRDPRAFAAALIAANLGLVALHEHLSRALGDDVLSPEGHLRMSLVQFELHSKPLLSDADLATARASAETLRRRSAAAADPGRETEGVRP